MEETEFPVILDRMEAASIIHQHYADAIELIKEVINYGCRLIVRAFTISGRSIKDSVLLLTMLKNAVTMLDSIEIQLTQGQVIGAKLQLRTIFETLLYLRWCFLEDTERRTKQFYVSYLRNKLKINKKVLAGTEENSKFKGNLKKSNLLNTLNSFTKIEDEVKKQNIDIETMLNSDGYKDINDQFELLKKNNRDCHWYQLYKGPNSIGDLASKLNMKAEYEIFYSHYSTISHSHSFDTHVKYIDGLIIFESVRDLQDIQSVFINAFNSIFRIYGLIIEHYLPSEVGIFKRKYFLEWRNRMLSIPKLEINKTYKEI